MLLPFLSRISRGGGVSSRGGGVSSKRGGVIRITEPLCISFATTKEKGATTTKEAKEKSEKKDKGTGSSKSPKAKKKGDDDSSSSASVESLNRFIEAAEAAKKFKPVFPPEELAEHARIAKEYRSGSLKRHNRRMKDLSTKICLQHDALEALPEDLRKHALIVDETPPPANRPWANWSTPPIPNFDAKNFLGKKEEDEDEESDEILNAASTK